MLFWVIYFINYCSTSSYKSTYPRLSRYFAAANAVVLFSSMALLTLGLCLDELALCCQGVGRSLDERSTRIADGTPDESIPADSLAVVA